MCLEEITSALVCGLQQFSRDRYVLQILTGASSISFMTWFLFLLAHLSTVAYTLINRSDCMLRDQRRWLRCHPGCRLLEASEPRQEVLLHRSIGPLHGGLRTAGRPVVR